MCCPAVYDDAVTASACKEPSASAASSRGKFSIRFSNVTSGVLSSSELGGCACHLRNSQPNDSNDSHFAPERITPSESARYTCSTVKCSQTCTSFSSPSPKLSA